MPSSSRPIFTRVFYNSCYKNANKGYPKIRKATKLRLNQKQWIGPAREGHNLPSRGSSDNIQQDTTVVLKESVDSLNNSEKILNTNIKTNAILCVSGCILSDSVNMVDNVNNVDRTGSLQNACPLLRPARFGFVKLGMSSRYRLADCSHKLPASSFSDWTVRAHEFVKRTGVPNYKEARIEVNTNLHLQVWYSILKDYHDPQLFDYLRFGFPLSVNYDTFQHNSEVANHASATNFSKDVNIYIQTELHHNALAGPFKTMPFKQLHCSPLLSRPKEGDSRRIIVNLSYPEANSVNSNILKEVYDGYNFSLSYPSVDDIVGHIAHSNDNLLLYKLDISRAFRNLRIDPLDYGVMGIHWDDQYFIDVSVAFGFKHGSAQMQRLGDLIRHEMAKQDFPVYPYIDDIIGIQDQARAEVAFQTLQNLIDNLGLPINAKKLVAPTKSMVCMEDHVYAANYPVGFLTDKSIVHLEMCNIWVLVWAWGQPHLFLYHLYILFM